MSKYDSLSKYLAELDGDAFTTNFRALEQILGFKLPRSARDYREWWANQGRGHSLAWQSAGWKTVDVSPGIETVTFIKEDSPEAELWEAVATQMTIAQAKDGLAKTFGVAPDQVEITIRA